MDPKYAAKDKFHALDKEVATISTKVDGQFNTLNVKLDGEFNAMREHMNAQFSDLESRQTKWQSL
ncbi:hypothetical protein [Schleiferilactobacillus perolens]|uniref:Uncharacterized protein n=1 Tax=Schleiferilactobacillus perolens DSM 12744 TaxID=1423792 RepID=A0A0R1N0R7_9LACO|nr:hypothetical protein [Schleiferilactobacillus perolens]KRL11908.1 hypothetical protein FD09_GL000516 [Schleiferilactobacillus perolens DSM 12744]